MSSEKGPRYIYAQELENSITIIITLEGIEKINTEKMAVFILEDALCVWTNLGKHSLFVWLFVSSVKTGRRRIIRLDELSSVVCRSSRTTEDSSNR